MRDELRRILFVASECAPFAQTGGLGDVVGYLPKSLARRGLDVRVVLPLYRGIPWDELDVLDGALEVPMGGWTERAAIRMGELPGSQIPVYFLEHLRFFDRAGIYGNNTSYHDNLERFTFLSRGCLQLSKALGWIPDLIHAHDWQTALVPAYLDGVEKETFSGTATLFTVHNLAHQGVFARDDFPLTGLGWHHWNPEYFEHNQALNLMKAGLKTGTLLSTVSPTYAQEIQGPSQGYGLDYVLRERAGDLHGILNGIDPEVWNPAKDPHLPATYDLDDLSGKGRCKVELQRELGLPVRPEVPLFAIIARLDPQKGLDIFAEALPTLLPLDIQFVLLGSGSSKLESTFATAATLRPDRFVARFEFNNPLAHRIEAGADFFVMPSRFEPCGLNQLYSLRYGTLPIVRRTGGLADTVISYEETTGEGTGFAFQDLHSDSLRAVIGWATWVWYQRRAHVDTMRRRAMSQDFTWERSAESYLRLYRAACGRRRP